MRLLISWLALGGIALGQVQAITPAEIWPTKLAALADAKLPESAAATLSPTLGPALKFQAVFLRILASAPKEEWVPPVRAFATSTETDPVSAGVREVAKAWLARAEMDEIGKALDQSYAVNVRYPANLSEVEKTLPPDVRTDPWGEAWTYQTHAPKGFANQAGQRYQVGPKRFPDLGTLRDAVSERKGVTPPAWKVILREVAGNRALEFQQNGAVLGVITAGAKIDKYTLLYVGDHWALMAGMDQLFTVAF